ncbi:hypothetical protein [Lutibacter sp.]|uniref:hypothetical protein n=1 Tax=Lutibacter sp. TaxID=1925666 RepID=UPI003565EC2C
MKKLLIIALLLFATGNLFAQTDGMSYQAVIINPNIQEIPGADVSGNILPNTTISIRFTIIDSNNLEEYQEVQTTTTDQYGMINLLIGIVDHDAFTLISWDGTNKDLKVEIDFNGGSNFVSLSREQLTFLPYASHRNITASGTLKVDEATFLNGELTVEEPTHLNSTLDVNNNSASNLTGDLTVGGATIIEGTTNLNSSLDVNNKSITNLSGALNVGEDILPFDAQAPTYLYGKLNVVGLATVDDLVSTGEAAFNDLTARTLEVTDTSHLIGATTVEGTTVINGITTINNATTINGATIIDNTATITGATIIDNIATINGATTLNSTLDVKNKSTTNLTGALNVGVFTNPVDASAPTNLYGTLNVNGGAEFAKNIKTGSLWVDGLTNLRGSAIIEGNSTNIKTTLTRIDNQLRVDGPTSLTNSLNVVGITTLSGAANLTGPTTTISGVTAINNATTITGKTTLNGITEINSGNSQVKINSGFNVNGAGNNKNDYPVLISGSNQGLAIQVNSTNSSNQNKNHYVSFYTSDGIMQGRIQGETQAEMVDNLDYKYELRQRDFDLASGIIDVAFATYDLVVAVAEAISAASSTTACAGFGAVVCSPIPSLIVENTAQAIAAGILEVFVIAKVAVSASWRQDWIDKMANERGVTYQSDAGDYAEYLSRADVNEEMTYGDIVGVIGGKVSKNTIGAERMMVVSYKPIVLGNMPQSSNENEYEKIAFMGQVPVKVFGKVSIGDYILPRGYNDGTGIAINPSNIRAKDINNIVGVAWESVENNNGFNMINVAVGLNANDNNPIVVKLEKQVSEQTVQINELKQQIAEIITRLVQQESGISTPVISEVAKNDENHVTQDSNIVYHEITQEDLDLGLKMAEDQMRGSGMDLENNPFFKQLKIDPNYKAELLKTLQVKFKNAIHYHKSLDAKVNPNY